MSDPEAIQSDIERTRAELASTVDQLSIRLTQQKMKAQDAAVKAGAVAGAVVVLVAVVRVVRAVRSRRTSGSSGRSHRSGRSR